MKLNVSGIKLKLLLVLIGFLVGFILLESIIRIYYFSGERFLFNLTPRRTTLKYFDHQDFGRVLAPNQTGWFVPHTKEYYTSVQVNSHGFIDAEHSFQKPEGVYRILFLGDSFVENIQVYFDSRFFRQFEKELNQNTGQKVEVIALGRGNTGTAQQYLLLKKYALKYNPDLVIHMFLTANDFKNNSPKLMADPYLPYFKLSSNGDLIQIPRQSNEEKKFFKEKELLKDLRLVELLLMVRQNLQEKKKNSSLDYPVDYHVYDKNYSEDFTKAWEVTQKLIIESNKEVENIGAKYILIALANNEQINSDVKESLFKTYPLMKTANIDFEKPDKELESFCQMQKIKCLFMLPFFKDFIHKNPGAKTHYFYDGHWNMLGTNLAAQFMIKEIPVYFEEKNK